MAKHDITIDIPRAQVQNRDAAIVVRSDGKKLGELRISRGSVDWLPHNHWTAFRLSWERFDELIRTHGRKLPLPDDR